MTKNMKMQNEGSQKSGDDLIEEDLRQSDDDGRVECGLEDDTTIVCKCCQKTYLNKNKFNMHRINMAKIGK